MSDSILHEKFMQKCFELSLEHRGLTTPNPLVGCVITLNDQIISTGAHKKSGHAHAELDAINNADIDLNGATLYCNLEPCCHTNKKTPPCAQRIIKEGIKKVIISNLDPNPLVAGSGVKLLEDNGIEVIINVLKEKGEEINRVFFHHILSSTPYIHLKWAQTLDGKIQSASGSSKWITNELARANVHQERLEYDAILVGANTARRDNPSLTVRNDENKILKVPKRLILSSSGDFAKDLNIFSDEFKNETILITNTDNKILNSSQLMLCPTAEDGRIDLNKLLMALKEQGICSLYVEGGSDILTQFLQAELFNEISVYIAPKLIGNGKSAFEQNINFEMPDAKKLRLNYTKMFEDNILFNFRK